MPHVNLSEVKPFDPEAVGKDEEQNRSFHKRRHHRHRGNLRLQQNQNFSPFKEEGEEKGNQPSGLSAGGVKSFAGASSNVQTKPYISNIRQVRFKVLNE